MKKARGRKKTVALKNRPKKAVFPVRAKFSAVEPGPETAPPECKVAGGPLIAKKFPIVALGGSAGGLEALQEFFNRMPEKSGIAFVVVTHQHPGYISLLPELLSKATRIPVKEAAADMQVEPDTVYVSPTKGMLEITGGVLQISHAETGSVPYLPIDHFLRSLAEDQRERAVCIILSGTGTDGTLGLRAVKEHGMAMVQQPATAKYSGMPSSALDTGLADYILSPKDMPDQLLAYVKGPYLEEKAPAEVATAFPRDTLQKILTLLRTRTGNDFSSYKINTVLRRIERRMNVHHLLAASDYLRFLQENPFEIDRLFKELLISVTSFFRDPHSFNVLAEKGLQLLIKGKADGEDLRFWVPGCATGEEVYSLAILASEIMEDLKKPLRIQIFGTDLDAKAIEIARSGVYQDGITADVSPQRLARYFTRETDQRYKIKKDMRESVIFAIQNVIKDPPFTKVDLIVCRNLLIYLEPEPQRKLLTIFHYALKSGGLLFLGPSETIGSQAELFEPLDTKWKLYRRKDVQPAMMGIAGEFAKSTGYKVELPEPVKAKSAQTTGLVERYLLGHFAPVSAVVDDRGNIVYLHGRTGSYLEPSQGQPRFNIVEMAREGLEHALEAALRHTAAGGGDVERKNLRVRTNGEFTSVDLSVTRIEAPEILRGLLLVTFRSPLPGKSARPKGRKEVKVRTSQTEELEKELKYTKESLQTTIEELETSNEELKSTNEELQSTNEELQSSNEELETSREELQSLNEELTTVNGELQSKVQELARANDDMQNLLNGFQVAAIFLDRELKVKRFTAQALEVANLIATDVGRPLSDLSSKLEYDKLVADSQEVLRTLVPVEKEVRTVSQKWHMLRIMPYRTTENIIDGLVLTLVDITRLKRTEKDLGRMFKVFMDSGDPILMQDLEGVIIDANSEAEAVFGWRRAEMIGQPVRNLVPAEQQARIEEVRQGCVAGECARSLNIPWLKRSGEVFAAHCILMLLRDEENRPSGFVAILKRPVPGC